MSAIPAISTQVDASRQRAAVLGPALITALIALVLYACTLGGTYIYDDVAVLADPRISHPNPWSHLWTRPYMEGAADRLYRPLTLMSFAIQWWIHGDRPWAFHLVNILFHAGV